MRDPLWIDYALVLALHDRLLGEHGGASGLRDESLLRSALSRPLNHVAYASSDIIELAAKYTAGIVQNRPFVDGNKRTGFVVGADCGDAQVQIIERAVRYEEGQNPARPTRQRYVASERYPWP